MTASIAVPLPQGLGHRIWFGRALPWLVARLFAGRIRVTGGERVPSAGPVLFVGRHRAGLMDGWLCAHAVPRPTVFVIAARLRRIWLLRPLVAGIAVERRKDSGAARTAANHAALLACREELAAGRTPFIFLIDKIVLVLEDGRLRIEIRGELAKILTLASAGQAKAATADAEALAVQVKMVAGAGFGRQLTPCMVLC